MPRTLAPLVLALTCLAALPACDLLEPEYELFEDLRHYVHAPPDCAPVPGTEQGCQAMVTFCPDGTAAYLELGGDIIEPGTYQVIGSRVRLDRTHSDRLLYFTLSGDDPTLLVDDWDREWVLATDGGFCPGSSSGEA